jgi:hypothetical protein
MHAFLLDGHTDGPALPSDVLVDEATPTMVFGMTL